MNCQARYLLFVLSCILLFLFSAPAGSAQVLKMDLPSIVGQSDLIIQARIVSLQSHWVTTPSGRNITTRADLRVIGVIKGDTGNQDLLTIELPGGTVGDTTQIVTSCVNFQENEESILFLNKSPLAIIGEFQGKYPVIEGQVQIGGLLMELTQFTDVLRIADTNPQALSRFLEDCKKTESDLKKAELKNRLKSAGSSNSPAINSISPDKASAGTNTKVTITGSRFGPFQGTARVEFYYQSGQPKIPAPVVSWTDTEIICKVPVDNSSGKLQSAASGPVTVITAAGEVSNSFNFKVTFGYGLIKWPKKTVPFKINESLNDITDEGLAIRTAANSWNSTNSGFQLQYAGDHTNTDFGQNDSNEILWGSFPTSTTIGRASIWTSGENILECDIKFNQDFKWSNSYDVPMDHMDIETIALHELGHWLYLRDLYGNLLDEEYDKAKVMYGLGSYGLRKRNFHQDDIAGINWIYGRPDFFNISGYIKSASGAGIEGVLLNGLPGNPVSNSNGYYSADVANGWSGTVTPEKTGYTFIPQTHNYVEQASTADDQDFTAIPLSTDANLSDLRINNITIAGFSSATLSYHTELPYGTTVIPTVTATTSHAGAVKVITQAVSLTGSCSIVVTAEDGITNKTYTVGFSVAKNHDATLSNLTINGATVSGFLKNILDYTVILPFGTSAVPAVTAVTTDPGAVRVILPANSLPGSTTVTVTAENGISSLIYTVNFSIAPPSTDASLTSLKVDDNPLNGFSPLITTYAIELPYRTTRVPVLTATPNDSRATLNFIQAASLPGISMVISTAEDTIIKKTYSVNFSIAKNTDATLSDLMVNGNTIAGFSSSIRNYQMELPFGTTRPPLVTAISNDGNASMTITPPESLPGPTLIHILAEDGTTSLEYTVHFTIVPASQVATLANLMINGLTVNGFRSHIFTYILDWPHRSTTYPVATAIATESVATVQITPADTLPGMIRILVTAQDGIHTNLYTIQINVAKDNDATLADLRVDNATISGFQPSVLSYTLVLQPETLLVPEVTATTADPNAGKIITAATALPGLTTVKVTAEDGTTINTYEINMRYPLSGIENPEVSKNLRVFPNPSNGTFQIEYSAAGSSRIMISIFDTQGRILYWQPAEMTTPVVSVRVSLPHLPSGIYYIRILDGSTLSFQKFRIG